MFYEQSENPCLVHHEFCRLQNMLVQEMKQNLLPNYFGKCFFALIFTILVQFYQRRILQNESMLWMQYMQKRRQASRSVLSARFRWKLPITAWKDRAQNVDLDCRESVVVSAPTVLAASLQMRREESAVPMPIRS